LGNEVRLSIVLIALGTIAAAQQRSESMTKLSVRLQSPEVPEHSFAAQPKLMYRSGNAYCRTEEVSDPENGIHGLIVVSEPDVWMVNLLTKTARHFVDPGPTFNCHLAIFAGDRTTSATADTKSPLLKLEFGLELSYFKENGAAPKEGPVLQGKPTTAYTAEVAGSQLFLFTTGVPERPWALARQHGNGREILWYGSYEQLPFDPRLFAKPDGVKIEEVK
jgi:hypothetical protein